MHKAFYTITKKDLFDLFSRLSKEHKIFVPYKKDEKYYFDEFLPEKEESVELGGIRQSQPFKSFISRAREKVLRSPGEKKSVIVAGVKACDLASLTLQDYVFLEGDFKDPFYAAKREETIIISNDCTFAKETCFCVAMGGRSHPQNDFDINLAPLGGSMLVTVASPKGNAIIEAYRTFFRSADHRDIKERDSNRKKVDDQVAAFIDKRGTPGTTELWGAVKKSYDNLAFWQDFSSTCVECGACNLGCPTCHCFLLYDTKASATQERVRIWDSCLYNTFARVAGDHNPRKHLYERLRNRIDKKFDFFPHVMNHFACTGCGRCIDACPGDIDIREILKGLVRGEWTKPPHD
jgi:sulfhydrogenase subunit beta (sulfur reductase)